MNEAAAGAPAPARSADADSGERKIRWAMDHMPVLRSVYEEFSSSKPFDGMRIALSIHLEAKTACLCRTLAAGGAKMWITGSNPLSTQDDVASALAREGHAVHARRGASLEEYGSHIRATLSCSPHLIIDDGGDLAACALFEAPEYSGEIIGGCEETTTGVRRLESIRSRGLLRFPMVLVNNADSKRLFDNRYGTGQSVWDAIMRMTNLIVASKTVVVAGYGWCGKGIAMRAKGLGARVIVTEVNPVKAMEALMDGFSVAPMIDAAAEGDVFITATGCAGVIGAPHFAVMKDGAILANAGHFDVEIDVRELEAMAGEAMPQRDGIMGYRIPGGAVLSLLCEGRLVNLAGGDGHPAEIMDMSFAIQALSARWLAANRPAPGLIDVPPEIDMQVAARKLAASSCRIDELTREQSIYLGLE